MSTRVILLGPPGAGKGTQAQLLAKQLGVVHISTGAMLRDAVAAKSPLGLMAAKVMQAGQLVADDLMVELVQQRVAQDDCAQGFILDGFPRTLVQAQALAAAGVEIDVVIELALDDEVIVQRISGRLVHLASGRTYHRQFAPPKDEGRDDVTGEALVQREDDQEATIRARLQVYHQQTAPLIAHYNDLAQAAAGCICYIRVDASQSVEAVQAALLQRLQAS